MVRKWTSFRANIAQANVNCAKETQPSTFAARPQAAAQSRSGARRELYQNTTVLREVVSNAVAVQWVTPIVKVSGRILVNHWYR